MKASVSIATFLMVGAGVAGAGAITPIETPLLGSDTLFHVTQDAFNALALAGLSIGPASTFIGTGSAFGQSAMVAGKQHLAPMTRMMTAEVCAVDTSLATGIVIGLDSVDVFGAVLQAGNASTCNASPGGFAFTGANGQGFVNYKGVLALIYGGLDTATGTVDCNGAKRQSVVNNWSALFENSCANTEPACTNAAHGVSPGQPAKLWHAFRRDEAANTADVFASLLGLSPSASATALNGFGTSPFCNALNWDTSAANANCVGGAGKQYIGPGGVPQGFCSITTTQACVIGATFCGPGSDPLRLGARCDPAPATNVCGGTGQCIVTQAPCPAGEVCQSLSGDKHRRPPLNVWGDDPDPNTNLRGESDADVLSTSFQDNDPIRRACLGASVYTVIRDAEEVCNRNGTLGLVVPVAATDFVSALPDPTHPGQNLVQYSMNSCSSFALGAATSVLTCAPRNLAKHAGVCPGGDLTFGSSHTCEVPIDIPNNTSQCQQGKTASPGIRQRLTFTATTDGRVYNLHMRDGTTTDGSVGYLHQVSAGLSIDFAGAFNRIHQVATIPAAGAGHTAGCTLRDADDQVVCFTGADRCSVGFGANGATTYTQRYANGTCAGNGAPCSINGNPCAYFSGSPAGPCVVAAQPAATAVPVQVNQVAPSVNTVQLLGDGLLEYPLSRKLYLNSLNFGFGVDSAGNPSDGGFDSGITLAELTLAQFESTVGTLGVCTSGVCSVGGAPCAAEGAPCASAPFDGIAPILVNDGFFTVGPNSPRGADTPFCEDFNAAVLCDAGIANDNACFRNPPQWVPGDISPVPAAATLSTVCGNGVVDLFEECDPAAPPSDWVCSVPGATTCSNTCRC